MTVLLSASGVVKRYGGITALHGVDFAVHPGQVHVLIGENGAGKSTLMKILAGIEAPTEGSLSIDGVPVQLNGVRDAARRGIGMVHQELNLCPNLTVAENIFLLGSGSALLDKDGEHEAARGLLARLRQTIDPDRRVDTLSIGEQQIVEIAKALIHNTRILVMDEPTAALDDAETERLFALVRQLRDEGVAIVFVSHRMPQVFAIADAITVLKDGRRVGTGRRNELAVADVVRMMVGRELKDYYPPHRPAHRAEPLLSIRGGVNGAVDGIDFDLHAGEIVVAVGLEGSGKDQLARAIFGAAPFSRGVMTVQGRACRPTSPQEAIRAGIGYVSDDRKAEGLALHQSVMENAMLALRGLGHLFASPKSAGPRDRAMDEILREIDVRAASYEQQVGLLSGGNQQKTVLARWLALSPPILLCAEPTRGIDVAAKTAIYHLLRRYADSGKGVLVITSDLPEAIGVADRLVVMHSGSIVGQLAADAREEEVMAMATGHRMLLETAAAGVGSVS
jgi:ribose transport system ATP-binding protein